MRKNARFRWSSEHGGDLITLTFRVAAVVNGVIGHCRAERWAVPKQDFRTKSSEHEIDCARPDQTPLSTKPRVSPTFDH